MTNFLGEESQVGVAVDDTRHHVGWLVVGHHGCPVNKFERARQNPSN
jgi:hypothetical protein